MTLVVLDTGRGVSLRVLTGSRVVHDIPVVCWKSLKNFNLSVWSKAMVKEQCHAIPWSRSSVTLYHGQGAVSHYT